MPSVLEQILAQSTIQPQAKALTLIDAAGEEIVMSFASLVRDSKQWAVALKKQGIVKGDLVLLLTDELAELIPLFCGALMIGALPAILPVPVAGISRSSGEHLQERIVQTDARMLITSNRMYTLLTSVKGFENVDILPVTDFILQDADPENRIVLDLSENAYVQFSSGTTGAPKGLLVSQSALYNQVRHYAQAITLNESDVMISWSPLYHDQGLVSNLLMPLSHGVHTVLMTPSTWLRNPVLFFKAVDRHKCTVSRWSNFAFMYTAQRITDQQMQGVSLCSLRLLASSGEPISPDAWPLFKQRFSPYGLRNNAMYGSYGMAENCLCISIGSLDEPLREEAISLQALNREGVAMVVAREDEGSQVFVSSGKAIEGTEIRIVNGKGEFCPDRTVGEIAIQGDCLLDRYYPDRPFSQNSFCNGFYLTGDMGYMADGWLTITGRKKDIVIVGGNCINPEQVEQIASKNRSIRPGRVIALGVYDEKLGTEKLIVICELVDDNEKSRQQVRRQLQERVLQDLSVWINRVEFRERGWIEKTTSGKLSRFRSREKLLGQEYA